MADTFYSVTLGETTPDEVTKGAATSSEAIELRSVDGSGITKLQLLNGLKAIEMFIIRDDEPA